MNDVTPATLAKRPDKFPGQFLSVVGGQLWCGACYSNVGSAMVSIKQHVNGQEHIKKVQINEVSVAKIESIILSIFRVKTIDYRFRFLE